MASNGVDPAVAEKSSAQVVPVLSEATVAAPTAGAAKKASARGVEEAKQNELVSTSTSRRLDDRKSSSSTGSAGRRRPIAQQQREKVPENLKLLEQELLMSANNAKNDKSKLSEIFADKHIELPAEREYKGTERALFIYTDLEPDDVFAILCELQESQDKLVGPPVTVFTTELKDKDAKPVFQKKLVLATCALGSEFADGMKVVSADLDTPVPWPCQSHLETSDIMREAVDAFAAQAREFPAAELVFLVMAPGRGNLGILLKCLRDAKVEAEVLRRSRVELYSGSFNLRFMKPEDIDFFEEATKFGGKPLTDVNHFLYTGGKDAEPKISNLAPFCPSLGLELTTRNPFLGLAWQQYAVAFDKKLLDPFKKEGNLFRKFLDKENAELDELEAKWNANQDDVDIVKLEERRAVNRREEKELSELKELFESGDFWGYVRLAHGSEVIRHINPSFKKRVITSLATFGFHEGRYECSVSVSVSVSVSCLLQFHQNLQFLLRYIFFSFFFLSLTYWLPTFSFSLN